MKTTITIKSDELDKDELRVILQAIRAVEQRAFPEKKIYISVEAPELSSDDMTEILTSIKPPYDYGPVIFKFRDKEGQT